MFTNIIVPQTAKKRKSNQRKRHPRKTTIYKWLRERISSIDFGIKYQGYPIHVNTNDEVLSAFRGGRWLDRMTNADFEDHFSGKDTFYFTGNGSSKAKEILVLIDIDCHKSGSLQGAIAFAEHLRKHHFPNLYFELSTNGNGVHGYLVLEKGEMAAEFLIPLLKRLDRHLKSLLSATTFDVEDVEIKGTPPVFTWGKRAGELANYKSGQLGKLPRDKERFEELRNTARITYFDLLKLLPAETISPEEKKADSQKFRPETAGSISGKVIGDEELGQLNGHYRYVAKTLMQNQALATSGRALATVEDVAVFLMLLRFFTGNMNQDGSLPQARFKGLWTALFTSGDIDRPFDDKRFAAIRNYLSSLGLLDWQDEQYRLGWTGDDRQYHRGQACRWKASALLMEMLDASKRERHDCVDFQEDDDWRTVKKREREEASFTGTSLVDVIQSLVRLPYKQVVRPILTVPIQTWRLTPEEIGVYITPLGGQWTLAA